MPSKKNISSKVSEDFIQRELQKRLGLNVFSTTFLPFSYNKRTYDSFTKKILDHVDKWDEEEPLFILLNLIVNKRDDKHASVIVITKYHENYTVGFFDPNGPLSPTYDKNVYTVVDKIAKYLHCDYYDFMEGKYTINTIGNGNCDALCLWFIYVNEDSLTKTEFVEETNTFYSEIHKDIKKVTKNINDEIEKMSKNTKKS